jgi:hypothetical protein
MRILKVVKKYPSGNSTAICLLLTPPNGDLQIEKEKMVLKIA